MNENYHLIQEVKNKPITFLYTMPPYDKIIIKQNGITEFQLVKENKLYTFYRGNDVRKNLSVNETIEYLETYAHKNIFDFFFYEKEKPLIDLEDILDNEHKLQSFFSLMRRKPNKEVLNYFFNNFYKYSQSKYIYRTIIEICSYFKIKIPEEYGRKIESNDLENYAISLIKNNYEVADSLIIKMKVYQCVECVYAYLNRQEMPKQQLVDKIFDGTDALIYDFFENLFQGSKIITEKFLYKFLTPIVAFIYALEHYNRMLKFVPDIFYEKMSENKKLVYEYLMCITHLAHTDSHLEFPLKLMDVISKDQFYMNKLKEKIPQEKLEQAFGMFLLFGKKS